MSQRYDNISMVLAFEHASEMLLNNRIALLFSADFLFKYGQAEFQFLNYELG
jgi:hypothetical protein